MSTIETIFGGFNLDDPVGTIIADGNFDEPVNGNMAIGMYSYKVSYVTNFGETFATATSASTLTTSSAMLLSSIPVSPVDEVIRKRLYRTPVNTAAPFGLLDEIEPDATTYIDIKNDAQLGDGLPIANWAHSRQKCSGWIGFDRPIVYSVSFITSAGTTIDTATPLETEYVYVTVNVNQSGVILPEIRNDLIGQKFTIFNTSGSNSLKLYPASISNSISGGGGGVPVTIAPDSALVLITSDPSTWISGNPGGGGGGSGTVNAGTVIGSILRWDGIAWSENTAVQTADSVVTIGSSLHQGVIILSDGSNTPGLVTLLTDSPNTRTYTIPDAGGDEQFVMTGGSQLISGSKMLSSALAITPTTNQIVLGTTNTVTLNSASPTASRIYTIPDVGANSTFIMADGGKTIGGATTFTSQVTITPTSNQLVLGNGTTTTINAAVPSSSLTYTIPDTGTNSSFVMTEGTQSITGAKSFSSVVRMTSASNQLILGFGTTTTINAASPVANRVYTIPDTNANSSFVMTDIAQTINGAKTLSAVLTLTPTTNQLVMGTGTTTTISATAPTVSRVYTLPDVGANSSFVMTDGNQTVGGAKTLSSALTISPTTNQLVMGTTNTTTISATAPSASRVYTLPDVGANSSFVMTAGTQTVGGAKTLSSALTISPTTNQLVLGTTNTTTISATAPSASRTYTIPDVGANSSFVMSAGTQTISGSTTFNSAIAITPTSNQIDFGTTNIATLNVAAPTSSVTYNVPNVGGSDFVMTAGAQTVGGDKTFTGTTRFSASANQMVFGTTNTATVSITEPGGGNWQYTVADINSNANFIMSESNQTINGNKTFSQILLLSRTTNQIRMGTTTTTTLNAAVPLANRIYTIPDVATDTSFALLGGAQTFDGNKIFSSAITVSPTSNQIVLGTTTTTTISATAPVSSAVYTIPDVGTNANFVLTQGTQTIGGSKTFQNNTTFSGTATFPQNSTQIIFCTTNTVTLSATVPASGNWRYTMADINNDADFIMSEGNQTINGSKTFSQILLLPRTTNQIRMGTTTTTTLSAVTPGANRVYTIPDAGSDVQFVMGGGTQTIGGAKTLSSALTITPTTNQLVLGTTNTTTINAAAPVASRTYTIPDAGTNGSFVLTQGAQTISGATTFSSAVNITPTANQLVIGTGTTTTIDVDAPVANRVYLIPDTGANSSFVMTDLAQTINGAKTLSSAVIITPTTNQLVLGTTNTTTINAAAPVASRTYTIPDSGANSSFVLTDGNQTINDTKTFSAIIVSTSATFNAAVSITPTTNQVVLGTTNTVTINSAAPSASRVYTLPDTGANSSFVMTDLAQTIGGVKTFSAAPIFSAAISVRPTTNQVILGTTNTVTINSAAPSASRVYTLPDTGANSSFVMTDLAQTIGGAKTFSAAPVFNAAISVTPTTNQIVLGTTNTVTISSVAPVASRTYTIPDAGANSSFVMTAGTQTISGATTFTNNVTVSSPSVLTVATTPSSNTDAANKLYVDNAVSNIGIQYAAVQGATTANLTITYSSSAGTLTGTGTVLTVDAISYAASDGKRLLVKDQTDPRQNGIFTRIADSVGNYVLQRTTDADQIAELIKGNAIFVIGGTINAGTGWKVQQTVTQLNPSLSTPGGSDVIWVQYTGSQNIQPGDGLNQVGSTFNVVGTAGKITVGAAVTIDPTYVGQTSITTLGTVATGTWQGSLISPTFGGTGAANLSGVLIGNGASAATAKTNPSGAFVGTTDVQILTNKTIDAGAGTNALTIGAGTTFQGFTFSTAGTTTAGNVLTSDGISALTLAAPAMKGSGAVTSLAIARFSGTTGTIIQGSTALLDNSGNITGVANITTGAGGIITATTLAGTLSTAAQANITSVGTLTSLTVGGAVTITPTTNQLVLGTTTTTTISSTAPSASRVYTIPDAGSDVQFVMAGGTQTIAGAKTLSSALTITPTTNQIVLGTTTTTTINAAAPSVSRTYTIPDSGANSSFVMTDGNQTINGTKTFSAVVVSSTTTFNSAVSITPTTNQLVFGTTNTVTINSAAPSVSRTYTIPDTGANSSFVMTDLSQTINGTKTFSAVVISTSATVNSALSVTPTTNQIVLGTTTTTTINAAAPVASRVYTLPDTGANSSFVMTDLAQTLGGVKTFSASPVFNAAISVTPTTNQIVLGTTNTVTINSAAPVASRTYTLPDTGANSSFVMTDLAQTVNGAKTLSAAVTITPTSNQLVLGVTNTVTLNAAAPVASRTYTIPDTGANSSFVMSDLAQTVNGAKTLSSAITITPTTNQLVLGVTNTTTISSTAPSASRVYTIPDAGSNVQFVMAGGTQTIAGGKTLSSALTITPTTNQLVLGTTTTTTISATAPSVSRIYTIPDSGANSSFVLTDGNQTINGTKTFSAIAISSSSTFNAAISVTPTTNQVVLGTTNTVTINAVAPVASRTYTIPDTGANSSFVMTDLAQTIGGVKTFSASPVFNAAISVTPTTNQIVLGTTTTTTINAAAPSVSRTYTIPDTGANSSFVMSDLAQTINGAKTLSSALIITPNTNQLVLGAGTTTTINAANTAVSAVYTIPDVGTASSFLMTAGAQTISGIKTFSTTAEISSGNVLVFGASGGSRITISATSLPSSATYNMPNLGVVSGDFVITAGNQTIGGSKTFSNSIAINSTTNQLALGSPNAIIINAVQPINGRTYTLPDTLANSNFIMSDLAQTLNGVKTFTSALTCNLTSNQLTLGSTNIVTINAAAPVANRTYTIPDTGANSSFVMTDLAQTINGVKTFSAGPIFSLSPTFNSAVNITPTTNQLVLGTTNTITINAAAPAASRVYTIPNTGASSNFVMTDLAQTLNGVKTFSSGVVVNATSSQLVLGSTNTLTLNYVGSNASRTLNLRDTAGIPSTVASTLDAFIGTTTAVFTGSIGAASLSITAMTSGIILLGSVITGTGITPGTIITAFNGGIGGTGAYTVNIAQTVASTTITATGGVSAGTLLPSQIPIQLNSFAAKNSATYNTNSATSASVQKARLADYKLANLDTNLASISGTITGICYNPNQDTLLLTDATANAGTGAIYEVTLDGSTLIKTINLSTGFDNPQDICWMYDQYFAIAHGGATVNGSKITIIKIINGATNATVALTNGMTITPSPAITNLAGQGITGVTYNPDSNVFYAVTLGGSVSGADPTTATAFYKINPDGTYNNPFTVSASYQAALTQQMSDLTCCHYDRNTGTCFLGSALSMRVIEIIPETSAPTSVLAAGQIIGRIEGPASQGPVGSTLGVYVPFATNGNTGLVGFTMTPDGKQMFMAASAKQIAQWRLETSLIYTIDDNNHRPQYTTNWQANPGVSSTAASMTINLGGNIVDLIADSSSATTSTAIPMLGTTLPAQYLSAGKNFRATAMGGISTSGIANVNFIIRQNATIICNTASIPVSFLSNVMWECNAMITVRSATTTTATVLGNGSLKIYDTTTIQMYRQTSNGAVTNTVTPTNITTSGLGTLTLPANFLTIGRNLVLRGKGFYKANTAATTLTIAVKFGATTILTTGAVSMTEVNASTRYFDIDVDITGRTTGSTGTVQGQGMIKLYSATANSTPVHLSMINTGATTIDTTVSQAVTIQATWSTATDNSITLTNLIMDVSTPTVLTFPMYRANVTASLTNNTSATFELVAQVNSGSSTITAYSGSLEVAS